MLLLFLLSLDLVVDVVLSLDATFEVDVVVVFVVVLAVDFAAVEVICSKC